MGYPRKSYPHRCSPPCAKRSRPRACARVYIIHRSPVGRSRECPRRCGEEVAPLWPRVPRRRAQGGGGRRQRRTPPRAVPRPCPPTARFCQLMGEVPCAKAEVHKANPAPARAFSPRQPAYGRAPARLWAKCRAQGGGGRRQRRTPPRAATRTFPAYGRITVRKGGSTQGNPRSCPCVLPASACLRPRPCPLMGEAPSAKAEVHKAIPAPARAFSPRRLVYGRALCPLMGVAPCVLPASARLRPCTLPADGRSAVRSSRVCPPKTAPLPADGRSAERRVGEGEGKGGRPLAQQPAPARAFSPRQLVYRPVPAV